MNNQRSKAGYHPFWHQILVIIFSEINNLAYLFLGLIILAGGLVLLNFATDSFYKIGIGLPLVLIGVSVALSKLNAVIAVIVRPKRLEVMCIFCQKNHD